MFEKRGDETTGKLTDKPCASPFGREICSISHFCQSELSRQRARITNGRGKLLVRNNVREVNHMTRLAAMGDSF